MFMKQQRFTLILTRLPLATPFP
eukprot:SAG25_NODE_13672_length_264_cov_0.630303_1_plen_22_part_10